MIYDIGIGNEMRDLIIQENNKLFSRPLMYKDGKLIENDIIVPSNMDRMYLKLETKNKAIVRVKLD